MNIYIYDQTLQEMRLMTEDEIETHLANVANDVNKESETAYEAEQANASPLPDTTSNPV